MSESSVRGHFLWHELMTSDPKAAIAFYTRLIGWEAQKWGQDPSYTLLAWKGTPMAGVMAIPPDARAMGAQPGWTLYIGSSDTHVTAWEAQRMGAKLVRGPETTPTVGTWAILQDPQEAGFGILTRERTPDVKAEPGIGDFSWHELATTDHIAAFDFYRDLFGWEKTGSFDMGPSGDYLMYGWGERTLGGMYTREADAPGHPAWLPYIHVRDVDAATKAIRSGGGKVTVGPMEVPGGDWITMAVDPQGAAFAIHAKAKVATPARKRHLKKKVTKSTAKRPKVKKTRGAQKPRSGKPKRK